MKTAPQTNFKLRMRSRQKFMKNCTGFMLLEQKNNSGIKGDTFFCDCTSVK